ncbi:NUDIX domain-containing protein [Candidatus Parcubacteria bacterium]|nr:NUDIX domain-containing protein [Candidatus Parcubacteria bacterium]
MLYNDIKKFVESEACRDKQVGQEFLSRAEEGLLTRDENEKTHFCVYFLPFNREEKRVFITHHKKSGLWISPGGHIDKGESAWQAVNREINEELGMKHFFKEEPLPFLLTITPIKVDIRPCKVHYDIWYLVETDGSKFNLDPAEFYSSQWCTFKEARGLVVNRQNLQALDLVEGLLL